MVPSNSLDEVNFIAALLRDVHTNHEVVFDKRALKNTVEKLRSRVTFEGLGFLTKSLPRLGKAFDKALSGDNTMNAVSLGFKPLPNSKLPMFMGEFFSRVLHHDGTVLRDPCIVSVGVIRQVLFVLYKYELPFTAKQEQQVLAKFERTEQDLEQSDKLLTEYANNSRQNTSVRTQAFERLDPVRLLRNARTSLDGLFELFDPRDIRPRHGPGAVATRQQLWAKYLWSNIAQRITDKYPLDEYFYSSLGHVCDSYRSLSEIGSRDLPARILFVPKDSRGPRLISCEPVDFQWVQQGLGRAIVRHVESHPLTKWNVFYTNQQPNQFGALLGSETGRYSTLDLNEASDRVSVELVRLLFPEKLFSYLEACRSLCTSLPDGRELKLRKFAPMGSALCFPILALTIWALLRAGATDHDNCLDSNIADRILVYGDDVIVPTAYAADAMNILESFGLKINRDKSCTKGSFRESCGLDAFKGTRVTPVRLRTVWSSTPSPESYSSFVEYANAFYCKKYFATYDYIVSKLVNMYWPIADRSMREAPISLCEAPEQLRPVPRRFNKNLQKVQYKTLEVRAVSIRKELPGWSMLLRYFAEACSGSDESHPDNRSTDWFDKSQSHSPFSVSQYTKRGTSILVPRWR